MGDRSTLTFNCLQMCINIPIPTKAQPAVGLPDGWTFVFQDEKPSSKNAYIPGLWIFWKKREYRSVEAASAVVPTILEENPRAVRDFYKHVGIDLTCVSGSLQSQLPSSVTNGSRTVSSPMSPEELHENKCGECVNCRKDDCGRCASCMNNKQATRNRQVCLQKVRGVNSYLPKRWNDAHLHSNLDVHQNIRSEKNATCRWVASRMDLCLSGGQAIFKCRQPQKIHSWFVDFPPRDE